MNRVTLACPPAPALPADPGGIVDRCRRLAAASSAWAVWLVTLALAGCRPSGPDPTGPSAQGRMHSANPSGSREQATRGGADELTRTPSIPPGPSDLFEDVTARAGITFVNQYCDTRISNIIESNGAGAAVLDLDNDGLMDLYFVNSGPLEGVTRHAAGTAREPNRLYRNLGNGVFEDITLAAGVAGSGYGSAAAAADYDNDGFTDLYVVNVGRNLLYRNRGNATFEEVTDAAGVGDPGTGISAVFVDVDNDGWLDLFVANYLTYDPAYKVFFSPGSYPGPRSYRPEFNVLYRNRRDGTFEDISQSSGVRVPGHRAMAACAFDFDLDGDPDLYVCNDDTPNTLLVNDGKGRFQEMGARLGVAYNGLGQAAGSMAAAIGDVNQDGYLDVLVSRLGYGSLYLGSPSGVFHDHMMGSGLGQLTAGFVGWGSNFIDFDNDGDLDIFVANGDAHHLVGWESLLLENDGRGNYRDAADTGGAYFHTRVRARGSAVVDFDNNGGLDLLVTTLGDRPFLLRNRKPALHHWLLLHLQGARSNRNGFGARIDLLAAGQHYRTEARCPVGFLSQGDPRPHFGLGNVSVVEQLSITWPSGTRQVLTNLPVNRILRVVEPEANRGS